MCLRIFSPPAIAPCRLASAVVAALIPGLATGAPSVEFNPRFLQGAHADMIDLSRFERGGLLPGIYRADIKVNGTLAGRRDVELRALPDGSVAVCYSPEMVDLLGVDPARLPKAGQPHDDGVVEVQPLPEATFCDPLSRYVPQASAEFDPGEQVLDVTIPQAWLSRDPRGWVSPELWDSGINAGVLGYSISHQRLQGGGVARTATGVVLNAGVNVGAWRLRHDGYYARSSNRPPHYRAGRSYAQRSIAGWGAELVLGEASTRGDLFEAVSFRGVGISTDPRMLPDSQRAFAPIVRGVAQTNARVTIRQQDHVLYQANVAAGPFEISDLYGTGYAGDLEVEVSESDGRVQHFVVPFAAVPELLRAGQQRYSATVGQLRDPWIRDAPTFAEATLRHGFNNVFTGYGGVTADGHYQAMLAGGAINTPLGAFSGDVTTARTRMPSASAASTRRLQGRSYRLAYSRRFAATDTYVSLGAYRYSTDGYLTLNDATRLRQDIGEGLDGHAIARQRSRLDLSLNQPLGARGGTLFASGSSVDYWNLRQRRTNFSVGYSNTLGPASYSVSVQRSRERAAPGQPVREGNSAHLNVTLPLGSRSNAPRMTAALSRRAEGRDDTRVGVSGVFGERRQGSYNGAISRSAGDSSYDAGVGYQASVASLNAGVSQQSHGMRGLSMGASGGVVVHAGGIAFAQQLGDTLALVHVPDAAGAVLDSTVGVKTDARGYAVVPYMTPFRRNEVTVDPKGLPLDVELKAASVVGVPTAGAVVKLVVPTSSGRSALIEAARADGQPLPFGLDVRDERGEVVGVVGQASRLWVRGIETRGTLAVRWGDQPDQQCTVDYDLTTASDTLLLKSTCRGADVQAPAGNDMPGRDGSKHDE